MEKLSHLLKHWIEHTKEHRERFEEFASKIEGTNPEVARKLREAAEKYREVEEILKGVVEG
uniref:DUF8180 domain-containing protein n=1 Tax=Archaeoglobus fulgidus TaxID=2234 RepID=A0A7C3MGK2_ARCFL